MIEEDHPTDETPNDPATPEPTETEPAELELWDRATVLKFFGGSKPIHVSTLYRGVHSGRYPSPMNVSDNVVRWIGHECRAARQRMLAERGKAKQPTGRGRKRRQIAHDRSGDEPVRPASARRGS
jgi:predicted DNA-binding transcriptional regulator AlpA